MAHPILMPKPGQMTEECVLVAWHKREGDEVRRGDVLFEIETDKAVMDVESFDDGVLLRRYVEEGQTVPVNTVCAYVGAAGEDVPDVAPVPEAAPTAVAGGEAAPVAGEAAPVPDVAPTGAQAPTGAPAPPDAVEPPRPGQLPISPRAARLAAELGVDPRSLAGSGPGGRIVERDVRAAAESSAESAAEPAPPSAQVGLDVAAAVPDEEPPVPLSRMRQVIAERLAWSTSTIPHFSVTVAVDMTRLVTLREELKATGTSLSVTDFVLASTAQALREFPEVNARTDGRSVWVRRRVHLGLAVSVPRGLVVPVIRDADRCSLGELHERAAALAAAARGGNLTVDDMTGGTFTVSNLGMFGVDEFAAIINPGEAGILAVSSITPTAVAVGDGLAIRQLMKLTLSADHRIVDSELAARFLNALRRRLQDSEGFRVELLSA